MKNTTQNFLKGLGELVILCIVAGLLVYLPILIFNEDKENNAIENSDKLARYQEVFHEIIPEWDIDKPFFSKQVEITAYISRGCETDSTPYTTANNKIVHPGGIAISRDLVNIIGSYGTKVIVKGYGTFVVNDIMNERYTNSIGIWSGDLTLALKHGRKSGTVIWQ
jgi:3D (Asp-Asp-Asp) domain-containing protein